MWFLVSPYTGARIYNGILNAAIASGKERVLGAQRGIFARQGRDSPTKNEYINAVSVSNEIYTERKGELLCVALAGLRSHPAKWWRQSCLCEKHLLEI